MPGVPRDRHHLSQLDDATPVLVGAGLAHGDGSEEAAALMVRAALAAAEDAGTPGLLRELDRVAVPKGTWSYADPSRLVANAIGAPDARTHLVEVGIPQQTLINDALRAIAAGESRVALVAGGEAKRRAQLAARHGEHAPETDPGDAPPDVVQAPTGELMAPIEIEAGIWNPVEQYALIENALRYAEGRSVVEHRDQIATLWEGFNRVARSNPDAAFPTSMTAAEIAAPRDDNRPLAFPYNKWHASQWSVDQAGALLMCSVEVARRHQVPEDRILFPLVGLESSHAVSLSRRHDLHRWPAMRVLGEAAARHLDVALATADVLEVYSCFPAAVRVQQRELGLPVDGVPTVTGGMTFAGGPLNNFVLQATAAVADRLRTQPGSVGVVTTVSGLLTKPGLAVWSSRPGEGPPLVADLAEEAAAATDTVGLAPGYEGAATVASYTVTYDGLHPARVIVIADVPGGSRCIAASRDSDLASHATQHELIGTQISVSEGTFATQA